MTKISSFKDLLFEKFEDEMFYQLSLFLEDAPEKAEIRDYEELESVEPSSMEIKFIQVGDMPGEKIHLDIVIESELTCTIKDRDYGTEEDTEYQWFILDSTVDISDTLDNFIVRDINVYSNKQVCKNPLSDSLVPIFWKDELEDRAEEFLRNYQPEALVSPRPIDTSTITEKLGVTVQSAHLSRDCSVFGMMVFADTKVRVVTDDGFTEIPVSSGTLFYDSNVFFMRTLGSVRNTIIHECVHWVYHKKAMALERLINKTTTDIRCQVQEISETKLNSKQRNPLSWMEWHANALAPRILMPKKMFKKKAGETISQLMDRHKTNRISEVIEEAISELASFFQVSKLSAKLRFIDIGYDEAKGAYDYQNENYIPCYAFKKGSIQGNQSFTLSILDFAVIYAVDSIQDGRLRKLIEDGTLKYVESSVCINHPKYIKKHDNGWLYLTEYARNHMDECCVKFNLKYRSFASFGETSKSYLFRKQVEALIPEISYCATENGEILDKAERLNRQSAQVKRVHLLLKELPGSFSKSLKIVMKFYNVTNGVLAKRINCSERTIQRYRNEDPSIEKDMVIDICIAMKLPLALAEALLVKAGHIFDNTERDIAMKMLLSNGDYTDIYDFHSQCETILNGTP